MLGNTLLVGLGFRARNGKDTVASYMQQLDPAQVKVMGFADDLKAVCRALFGMQRKDATMLQFVGQMFRRERPFRWIDCLQSRVKEVDARIVVVPDVRYQNEVDWIKLHGGLVVRVDRVTAEGEPYVAQDRDTTHSSESELASYTEWDRIIRAHEGDFETLQWGARVLYEEAMDRRCEHMVPGVQVLDQGGGVT